MIIVLFTIIGSLSKNKINKTNNFKNYSTINNINWLL